MVNRPVIMPKAVRQFLCVTGVCGVVGLFSGCGDQTPVQTDDPLLLWQSLANEKIIFMSRADAPEGELYMLKKDGSIVRLTNNDRHENNPALSRDGTRIAFNGGDEADALTWEIYTLDLTTGQELQLTDNQVIDAHPDWSPDGSQIVFGSFRDDNGDPAGTADIYRMESDGSDPTRLTFSPWEDNDPEFSPNGNFIAFKSNRLTQIDAREEIFFMANNGTNVQRLTITSGWQSDHDPSWGPDNLTIVFSRYDGNRPWTDMADPTTLQTSWNELIPWNIQRVALQGQEDQLTDVTNAAGLPVYAVDGTDILYLRMDYIVSNNLLIGAHHRLILMNANGSDPVQLLPDDEHTGTLEYWDW